MSDKVLSSIYLEKDIYEQIKRMAENEDRTIAYIIRRLLGEAVKRKRK